MKKIILSLFILSVFTFSCESSDDEITFSTPDYLSGKWVFKKVGTINAQNVLIYQDYTNVANCEEDNILINATDNTFALNDFEILTTPCVNLGYSGTYSLFNKDLKWSYVIENVAYEEVFTIVSLTNEEITISGNNDLGEVIFYKLSKE